MAKAARAVAEVAEAAVVAEGRKAAAFPVMMTLAAAFPVMLASGTSHTVVAVSEGQPSRTACTDHGHKKQCCLLPMS